MYTNDDGDEVRECISCDYSQTSKEQAQETLRRKVWQQN